MPEVRFTYALKRLFPDLEKSNFDGNTVAEVVKDIENKYPGLPDYIVEENGALRQHVNIFVNNKMVKDRLALSDLISEDDEIYVMQALSGG